MFNRPGVASKVPCLAGFCRTVLIAGLLMMPTLLAAREKPYRAEGVRILAMAVQSAGREETLATGEDGILGRLKAEGVTEEEIVDGSVVAGIVYCCGGKISEKTRLAFYVPPGMVVSKGDIVEIALGRAPDKKRKDAGRLNRAVTLHENLLTEGGACRWDPPEDGLWMRVLYCPWMEERGWVYQGGLNKTWYLPVANSP
jgi:hypothetical protein